MKSGATDIEAEARHVAEEIRSAAEDDSAWMTEAAAEEAEQIRGAAQAEAARIVEEAKQQLRRAEGTARAAERGAEEVRAAAEADVAGAARIVRQGLQEAEQSRIAAEAAGLIPAAPSDSAVARRLVLWDVDGTLISTSGIGAAVFDRALEQVLGTAPASRLALGGKTDPQIALEYLQLMAAEEPDRHLPRVIEALEAEVAAAATLIAERGRALPGVPELLARLAAEPGVHQTLLTGNTSANAAIKVAAFGLQEWLDLEIGAYGSDAADRRQLVPIARERARRLRGADVALHDTWVVGDTAHDLACARAGGARCLLVATGQASLEELRALQPDVVRADLSDTERVARILLR